MVQRPDDDADPHDDGPAGDAPTAAGDGAVSPGSPEDFAAKWSAIVADLGEPRSLDLPDADPPVRDETPGPRGGDLVRGADERILSGRDWDATTQFDAAEDAVDEQEHFLPPDPRLVLGSDPLRILTWAVAIAVPALYVVMLVAWRNPPGWLAPVAGGLLVAAVSVLVWRMPHRRDPDSDSDSGAVV